MPIRLNYDVLLSVASAYHPPPMKITVSLHRRMPCSLLRFLHLCAGAFLLLDLPSCALAADDAQGKLTFDIPSADAIVSLKAFSLQSGQEIIYSPDTVMGTRTNEVKGEYMPKDAIDRMLAGTVLISVQNSHGLIMVNRRDGLNNTPSVAQASDPLGNTGSV